MVNEGYIADVKAALLTHISEASADLQPEANHVFSKWELNIWETDTDDMPIVTVRIGPITYPELVFGRKLSSSLKGKHAFMYFTAHLFEECATSGDPSKPAMDLADVVMKYLEKSDDSASGIIHYERLTSREASGMQENVARIIIEGYIFVRRPL